MNKIKLPLALLLSAVLFSCNEPVSEVNTEKESDKTAVVSNTEEIETALNIDSLVQYIDKKKEQIETTIQEPEVIETAELRAKIKQKWEKIHFYTIDNEVVRIKTYPYASISERTEEFYLENRSLIAVTIEDNGAGERNKSTEAFDKIYYFSNNEVIRELKLNEKTEHSIKDGDAEELISEVTEYIEIYKNNLSK